MLAEPLQRQQNASLLAKNKMAFVSQPAYPPDVDSWDLIWFPGMNQDLKGRRFADVAEVQRESLTVLDIISVDVLNNVSSSGSGAWITASSHRGTNLKGTKVL
jgi:hypothetical protein